LPTSHALISWTNSGDNMPDWIIALLIMAFAGTIAMIAARYGKITEREKNPRYYRARMNLYAQSHCRIKVIETSEIFELDAGDTLTFEGFQILTATQVMDDDHQIKE